MSALSVGGDVVQAPDELEERTVPEIIAWATLVGVPLTQLFCELARLLSP
jgi:hypothetical protein